MVKLPGEPELNVVWAADVKAGGLTWTAPAVQATPARLATPRWSVVGQSATWLDPRFTVVGAGIRAMPALPVRGRRVLVTPPLAASGPRSVPTAVLATLPVPPARQVGSPAL